MRARRIFVAGSTGATGRTVMRLGTAAGLDLVPHLRPATAARGAVDPRAAVFELSDAAALEESLRGCTTVLQLIGTMRKRFARGDTYETSDIGTTRQLVEAAVRAGVDHIVLLSSVGAGRPVGAYLQAKAKAEQLVRDSGIAWTVVRPSAFMGEGHPRIPGLETFTRAAGLWRYRPIEMEDLARALLHVATRRAPLETALEGRELWAVVEAAR